MTKKDKKGKKINKDANKKEKNNKPKLKSDVKRGIIVVLLFLMATLFAFGFFGIGGSLGEFLNNLAGIVFGWGKWLFPITLLLAGGILLRRKSATFYTVKIIGLTILFLSLLGFFHIFFAQSDFLKIAKDGQGGGYIGYMEASSLIKFTGKLAGSIVLLAFSIIGIMVTFNFSVLEFFTKLFEKNKNEDEDDDKKKEKKKEEKLIKSPREKDNNILDDKNKERKENKENQDNLTEVKTKDDNSKNNIKKIEFTEGPNNDDKNKKSLKNKLAGIIDNKNIQEKKKSFEIEDGGVSKEWKLPPLELLDSPNDSDIFSGDIDKNKEIIQDTFANFGIELKDGGVSIGPTVTQYSFRPPVGVKLSKIMALSDNLALALAVHPIRIEAPIPGKSLIGIEVPNEKGEVIRLRKILESDIFQEKKNGLTLALGEDVEGEYAIADLGEMPHLLVAGATGTGKSVCINSIILSLLFQNSPDDLKMILVDPKRVELSLYDKIPHLLSDVIIDNKKVINALRWAINEMEGRYKILQSVGSRDLKSYSKKVEQGVKRKYIDPDTGDKVEEDLKKLPFIVIIIDELADLMISYGKEIESSIMRLAQMSRAVGIHLIVSTQSPRVEIITGIIKANIATRIALQVVSQVDSRTIINIGGAEKLLGNGDMLFLSANSSKPKRIQNSFVTEDEVKRVVKFIKKQDSILKKNKKFDKKNKENNGGVSEEGKINFEEKKALPFQRIDFSQSQVKEERDDLYEEVKDFVIKSEKASASFIQRRFKIGFNRAARIVDDLEEAGIVAPADGNKAREIIVDIPDSYDKKEKVNYDDEQKDQAQRDKWQM